MTTLVSSLTSCRYLKHMDISYNPIHGTIPASFGNLSTSLQEFRAANCTITGAIPNELGNLSSLLVLDLSRNKLTGIIPKTIGKLKYLQRMSFRSNQLEGYIPNELCQMSGLGELFLYDNLLIGQIPECLSELKFIKIISLGSNKLNSTIPSDLWSLSDLLSLNLSKNYLSGHLSSDIGSLKGIRQVDLSSNQLSGDIPSSIDGCQSLEILYLSNNEFKGNIPKSLGNVRGLSILDLSNNNLSGLIPKSFEDLQFLQYFDVSYNRLEGEIPNGGPFLNFTSRSFLHNSALCGAKRFLVSPCVEYHGRSRSEKVNKLLKYILPPFLSTIILAIVIVMLMKRRKQRVIPPVDTSPTTEWRRISYVELERGTNTFSEANLLGRGSFGSVFKATLNDGLDVAAKVFNLQLEGAAKSFDTESEILSSIRHRNLVRVIGCCSTIEFKALILTYMPNGSLEKWLYSGNYCLDLLERLNIATDVALALEHLHHGHTFTVVHCDIKPSNVLLDEDMTAYVSDFGISKLFDEGETIIHTKTLATVGYAAPGDVSVEYLKFQFLFYMFLNFLRL